MAAAVAAVAAEAAAAAAAAVPVLLEGTSRGETRVVPLPVTPLVVWMLTDRIGNEWQAFVALARSTFGLSFVLSVRLRAVGLIDWLRIYLTDTRVLVVDCCRAPRTGTPQSLKMDQTVHMNMNDSAAAGVRGGAASCSAVGTLLCVCVCVCACVRLCCVRVCCVCSLVWLVGRLLFPSQWGVS